MCSSGSIRGSVLPLLLLLVPVALCPACEGGEESPARPVCRDVVPAPCALWSEFLTGPQVLAQVPLMMAHRISLYQNIKSVQVDARDPEMADLFSRASCQGLEVRAWLTLPEDQGYWPNETNVDLFAEKALELAAWIRSSGWPIEWIIVDMEPSLQLLNRLLELAEQGDFLEIVELLLGNRDPEAYAAAVAKFTDMVLRLQALGFRVMVVTFPVVLDDDRAGQTPIQDMLNTPVSGVPWDEVSFMAYTTTFTSLTGLEFGADLVYSYGRDAVEFYGDRAALDLGTIGYAGMVSEQGITDLDTMLAQVGAAKAAGLSSIHSYSLDGILSLKERDPEVSVPAWMDMFRAGPRKPPEEENVTLLRGALGLVEWLFQVL